jgi:hypothetical protein
MNSTMSGPIIKHNEFGGIFEVKMWAYLRGRGEFFGFKQLTGCGPNSWEGYFFAHGDPRDDEFCSCNISEEFKYGGISPKLFVVKPDELHKLMMPVGFTRLSAHVPD